MGELAIRAVVDLYIWSLVFKDTNTAEIDKAILYTTAMTFHS